MATFRKKPVEIEAWLVSDLVHAAGHDWKALPPQVSAAYENGDIIFVSASEGLLVRTLEGMMAAGPTDRLICGVAGELYPCKVDIFRATYDPS